MACCCECFAHPWLQAEVIRRSKKSGHCDYCGSWSVSLVEVRDLYDLFHNLCSAYFLDIDDLGDPLVELVQEDHGVFSERLYGEWAEGAANLLNAIMASGWEKDSGEDQVDAWANHRSERFHTGNEWRTFSLGIEVGQNTSAPRHEISGGDLSRSSVEISQGHTLHRARAGFNKENKRRREPHSRLDIGAPSADKARNARASKEGEVVFYAADDEATAVAEIRPAQGEFVSVGTFRTARPLRLLDLSKEPRPLNPFTEKDLGFLMGYYDLLQMLGDQMAKPLEWNDDQRDYIPCQNLSQAIRDAGYDGIRYPSAMHPAGTNVVLFDPAVVTFETSRLVKVAEVKVSYKG